MYISGNLDDRITVSYKIGVYRIAGSRRCCYFADLWLYFKPFCVMIAGLFWCAYTAARGTSEYLPITRSLFAVELSQCRGKMADVNSVVSVDLIKNALPMPRLAISRRFVVAIYIDTGSTGPYSATQWRYQCSAELGWPSHSMCSSPHWQVGQSWFREKLSPANQEQRLSQWADFTKNCLPQIGTKLLPQFRKKYRVLGRQTMGSNMRPRYIQFRDIHDRNISGVHCISCNL